jgi:predicted ATP-grasp superfamily ATP-dependent carboligase
MKKSVLVTDASQRKSVPIIRSLGRKGVKVVAGEDAHVSMGFYSKYTTKSVVYPAPENEIAFISWLIEGARSGLFDFLFPIDERTMEPVTKHLPELRKHMVIPVVDHPTFTIARNKAKTVETAAGLGIPVPHTLIFSREDDIASKLNDAPIPAVIKATESSGSRGLSYAFDRVKLFDVYMKVHKMYPFPLVQEYIPTGGDTFGVELLCNHGSILRTFVHRRIREFPIKGGPSTLRESYDKPEIVEYAKRLLSGIGWHGVAMVEFKEDPTTGKCMLMEINPKFWGSIALPIKAEVDFPYLLYQIACNIPIGKDPGYAEHIMCRWLVPGDVLHFLANPDRFKLNPSFFQFKGMHYDLLEFTDLGTLFGMFLSLCKNSLKKDFWKKKILR